MPPKPAAAKTTPTKPATKAPTKAATDNKTPAKGVNATAPSKTGATTKAPSSGATKAGTAAKAAAPIKKVLVPEEIQLKEIAGVMNYGGAVGEKLKQSGRWMLIIDRNGNCGTFLKYRDVNMIQVTSQAQFATEPMRKALMGSLKFGKPAVLDISDSDQEKIMDVASEKYNEIYPECWTDLMDHSIMKDDNKWGKLYQENDPDDYDNKYDYHADQFQFIVLTNLDPASTAMENFFPVIVN
ncbi:IQ motif and ankyrin repeat domain-containing protein 1-like [Dreissena polymorpha]|uniref:Uncharacterized protein n=1 Tax=Dreissena polymorpha TaxID=45954 RepID=A0A9D4G613_DREPO|nr:IQ motif and ankyrin repeat domain-containing protein 1-like [Dreissena polymorpha]KAH3809220.1 hypothetical protein DPMN_137581 [Dreissena polymorpha]